MNYFLLFHTAAELFSIIISVSIFLFAWNTRHLIKNHYFLLISFAFLFVGIIDFFHTATYKGINLFPGLTANVPTQLWIVGRFLLAGSFLVAPLFIKRRFNLALTFLLFATLTTASLIFVFNQQVIPPMYVEGQGLTDIKIILEYALFGAFILAAIWLYHHRQAFDPRISRYLILSLIINALAELLFSSYYGVYDSTNFLGHILVVIATYLVYRAVIQTGLNDPFSLLFLEVDRLSRQKDESLSIASHDIKNPLTAIINFAGLINKKGLKDPEILKNYSDRIVTQAYKINHLVQNLLDVSKIESGKLDYEIGSVSINQLIQKCTQELAGTLSKHQLVIKIPEKEVQVQGDFDRLSQAVNNLINNAIKYSPAGGKVIVRLKDNDRNATISISDSGVGIPSEEIDLIFNKFHRIKNSENIQGTGLGLYIVKEVIKHHGGQVKVQSQIGRGSTFTITLPLAT